MLAEFAYLVVKALITAQTFRHPRLRRVMLDHVEAARADREAIVIEATEATRPSDA